ncbi:hypothetical protein L1987_45565 [Smallanthus sonchifolius]|uniref:Uncharacterized protein n=1 Tax=Smallanthus sonchifolius TaxID=185202 RepID=A0ACB9FYE2_9ASTR|nr:hypothetical protein L1987_45565 [Smallanthus sonchifolius]
MVNDSEDEQNAQTGVKKIKIVYRPENEDKVGSKKKKRDDDEEFDMEMSKKISKKPKVEKEKKERILLQLKTKLEKIQKKSKSKKMTDEKNVKSEGRVKVDGIPAKLGHYVVDKFDPERMEINLGNIQIKVDNESVHQLLGIPNGGKELTSLTYKKKLEGNVKTWRNLYEEKYVAPPDIVKRISQSSDDDSILFKLDFLVLFMSTMVEIQKHGKCKLDFIHYITDDTDLGGIDRCSYIINSMKKCKEGWERCNVNSKFTGALTILTGDESDVDEKCNEKEPNMENLSDDFFQPDNLTGHLSKLDAMFDITVRDKKIFERALCEAYSLYPENKEVKEFVEKYKSVYKEIIDVEKDVADTEKDEVDTEKDVEKDVAADTEKDVEKDVADNEKDVEKDVADTNWTQFFNNNLEEIIIYENAKKVGTKEKEKEGIDTEVKEIIDTEKKEEIIEPTLPNFSFKLSQSTQESEKESKVDEPTEKTKDLLKDGKKKASTPENKYVRKNEKRLKTVTKPLRSPYIVRAVDVKKGVNAQERLIWEYLTYGLRDEEEEELEKLEKDEQEEVENSFMNDIFGIGYGLESKKFLLASLNPGVELYGNVIDCWAAVLNYEEKFRNPESPNRLFCYASTIFEWMITKNEKQSKRMEAFAKNMLAVVEGFEVKLDLKSYDLVFYPVLEKHHFYLICFNLKFPAISVIDNMHPNESLVKMKDSNKYISKSTPFKVKYMFVSYLKSVKHP